MKNVTPKKYLGQHFLIDLNIAKKISKTLKYDNYNDVLEIGPGMGVLTKFLIKKTNLFLVEVDNESVTYLNDKFPELKKNIINKDFLKINLRNYFKESVAIIGNFPYNISSQIIFKVIENRNIIPFFSGMFQKEVAQRICEPPGSKKYGIISVICQLYYETTLLFTVPPTVFNPKPKVDSAVIQLNRKQKISYDCDEKLLFHIIKISFQQRRKTLRNSLKSLSLPIYLKEDSIFDSRPESLSCKTFVKLTKMIENVKLSNK
ncbi:MAG: 16S rRNA (adenine(1518)-N(6)/adenine(1519)-N(6))-dimethyltransferase [Flavobacteriales bacterium]|jgi:16S rRNA (adenine1518-N6/adenine1519-N6)-dimethyltransferase|nr:16S rRNA (adenine(1518)-N(6)/adenine(1519)-N(6))-dimethyltransferase [Flavobacteriaceae bacterium]MBQ22291.1 16S rRNA (adenine(1518)-N(6)/adenine(1519)-N(6))-dimethyltransferase [Flavobacteriales bacterium]|tara:strand:- start:2652 stop:3434 length:783 start_codon:yes stop_codon:yes gene_type:complete